MTAMYAHHEEFASTEPFLLPINCLKLACDVPRVKNQWLGVSPGPSE